MEVRNIFKGLDLIDIVPDELWTEVRDIVQETRIKTIPKKKNMLMLVQMVRKTFFRTIVINVKTIEILGSSPNTASE